MADQVSFTYDGWGNLEHFKQDLNSTVNADAFDLTYAYAKLADAGRNTILRTGVTYPDGTSLTLSHGSSTDLSRVIAHYSGRVDRVSVNTGGGVVNVAKYDFLGVSRVVGIRLPFTGGDVHSRQYGSTSGSYPDLDQFNRVTVSRWSKVRSSGNPVDWYNEVLTYDNNSNISRTDHGFFDQLDALFTVDDLDRIADVQVGDYSGGSISNDRLGEMWDLTQAGNWDLHKLDLSGDGDYADGGEFVDNRTFNLANELTDRDLDTDGDTQYDDANYDLVYDAVGNLTDDGQSYQYVYDIRGQLTQAKDPSGNVVAKYRYNGLGYMISQQFDYDANGALDNDEWRHFVYDEQWRVIEVYRGWDDALNGHDHPQNEAENDPKERYVYHAAGMDGTASYIDSLILRDRDAVQPGTNTDPADTWSFGSDGTLEERVFFCQSWRADVVLVLDDAGDVAQRAWYSPYGVPTGCDETDVTADGFVNSGNSADTTEFTSWVSGTEPRGDWNLDGSVNSSDTIAYLGDAASAMTFGGRGALSSAELDIRFGYAGYTWDPVIQKYHVRNRVYGPFAGRWLSRDPIEYDAGVLNLYEYAASGPLGVVDPLGLQPIYPPGEGDRKDKKDYRKRPDEGLQEWLDRRDDIIKKNREEDEDCDDCEDKPRQRPVRSPAELKPLPGERSVNPGGRDNERDNLKDQHPDFDRTVDDIETLGESVNKRPGKQGISVLKGLCEIFLRRFIDPQPTEPIDGREDQLPGESDDAYEERQKRLREG